MSVTQEFSIDFRRAHENVVVAVSGELDVATAPVLRARLSDLIENQGNMSLAIDMKNLTFMDSTGVHVLVQASSQLRARGGQLKLTSVPPSTYRLLTFCGITRILPVEPMQGVASPG